MKGLDEGKTKEMPHHILLSLMNKLYRKNQKKVPRICRVNNDFEP